MTFLKNFIQLTDSNGFANASNDAEAFLACITENEYDSLIKAVPLSENIKFESGWNLFKHKIPMWIFIVVCIVLTFLSVTQNLSLIPVLGVVSCLYMMAQIELKNWIGFTIWLVLGLIIYFSYGYRNSKLNKVS